MRLLEKDIPQLSDKEANSCDKPVTIQEIGKALKDLPNKKHLEQMVLLLNFTNFSG